MDWIMVIVGHLIIEGVVCCEGYGCLANGRETEAHLLYQRRREEVSVTLYQMRPGHHT